MCEIDVDVDDVVAWLLFRTALDDLRAEHQQALEHVVKSKNKELDAVTHANDHAQSVMHSSAVARVGKVQGVPRVQNGQNLGGPRGAGWAKSRGPRVQGF